MAYQLTIDDGTHRSLLEVPLGTWGLGSGSQSPLRIDHEEVPEQALRLENRGKALLVQNLCEYDVFVGEEPLGHLQTTRWGPDVPLQLTRSVSLQYQELGTSPAADSDAPATDQAAIKAKRQRQMMQVGVLIACGLIAMQQLFAEPRKENTVSKETFSGLQGELTRKIDAIEKGPRGDLVRHEWQDVLRLLQEADFLEHRPGRRAPSVVADAYERVLRKELIDQAGEDTDSLERRISEYSSGKRQHYSK